MLHFMSPRDLIDIPCCMSLNLNYVNAAEKQTAKTGSYLSLLMKGGVERVKQRKKQESELISEMMALSWRTIYQKSTKTGLKYSK